MVSVIVPAYNIEEYLPRCLESILNQSYRDLEIILVDDGSTDSTGVICDEYAEKDSRVVVIHKENGGVSSARNLGLDRAKGDYIGFVDGDDILHRDYFLVLYENAIKHDCDISVCRIEMICLKGKGCTNCHLETGYIEKETIVRNFFFDENIKEIMYGPYNKLFRANVIDTLRFKNYKFGEDLLFVFMSLDRADSIYFDDYVGYSYIRREGSATKSNFSVSRLDYVYAAREIAKLCEEKYVYAAENAQCWVFMHTLNSVRQIIMCGKQKELNDFFVEQRKYLKKNAKYFLPKLGKKKTLDYFIAVYFPLCIHI